MYIHLRLLQNDSGFRRITSRSAEKGGAHSGTPSMTLGRVLTRSGTTTSAYLQLGCRFRTTADDRGKLPSNTSIFH